MNIFKRLKNLWRLSEYEPLPNDKTKSPGDIIASITKRKKQAKIVDMFDPLQDIDLGDKK